MRTTTKKLFTTPVFALALGWAPLTWANPVNGTVAAGNATFSTTGSTLTVTNSSNTIINWQGFSIAVGETTRFVQPSSASAVLNRVTTQNVSSIQGSLQSNGRVFLVNPNGILFSTGAQVSAASFTATTGRISDEAFLSGNTNVDGNSSATMTIDSLSAIQGTIALGNVGANAGGQPNSILIDAAVIVGGGGSLTLQTGSSIGAMSGLSLNLGAAGGTITLYNGAAAQTVASNYTLAGGNQVSNTGGAITLTAQSGIGTNGSITTAGSAATTNPSIAVQPTPLPAGGKVVSGNSIVVSGNAKLPGTETSLITQSSGRSTINWQQFSIGVGETTRIVQPSNSSVVLNRVNIQSAPVVTGKLQTERSALLLVPNTASRSAIVPLTAAAVSVNLQKREPLF